MRIDASPRGGGKTTRMIEWLRENPHGILYVHNEREAERLRDQFDPDGIREIANRIVTPKLRNDARPSFYRPPVAIDNADLILRSLLGDVQVVTITEEES